MISALEQDDTGWIISSPCLHNVLGYPCSYTALILKPSDDKTKALGEYVLYNTYIFSYVL